MARLSFTPRTTPMCAGCADDINPIVIADLYNGILIEEQIDISAVADADGYPLCCSLDCARALEAAWKPARRHFFTPEPSRGSHRIFPRYALSLDSPASHRFFTLERGILATGLAILALALLAL